VTSRPFIEHSGFTGVNNAQDPLRIGPKGLQLAENVDIDDAGIISRRGGHGAAGVSGDFHSFWSNTAGTLALAVRGADLVIVNPGYGVDVVRSGLSLGQLMSYTEVNDEVWYTNGQVLGFVKNRRDGVFPAITKAFSRRMPAGHIVRYFSGRMYVVRGNDVYGSAPMDFGRRVVGGGRVRFSFPGLITLFEPVLDGIYIAFGTTAFIQGVQPSAFVIRDLAAYDAVPGTATHVNAELISGRDPLAGDAVVWESTQGPCVGLAGGTFLNIAVGKYNAPSGVSGAGIYRKNRKGTHQFLTILQQ